MKINETYEKAFLVLESHSAKKMGSGDLEVLSTPVLVAYMEETARDLLKKYLDKELGSVGSNININHIAPTKIGSTVKVKAEIIDIIKERFIKFNITAFEITNDENKEIGNAEHTRVIINNSKFLSKL